MIAKLQRYSLNIVFLGIGIFLLVASFSIKAKGASFAVTPRFVPLALSSIMIGLAVWTTVLDVLKGSSPPTILTLRSLGSIVGFLAIVLVFILLMGTVNFHLLTFVFLVVAFVYLGTRSVVGILCGAASLVAFQFGIFDFAFRIVFP